MKEIKCSWGAWGFLFEEKAGWERRDLGGGGCVCVAGVGSRGMGELRCGGVAVWGSCGES